VVGWSKVSPFYAEWEGQTRERLRRADLVIALVGDLTRLLGNVRDEIEMARELGLPVIALKADADPSPPDNVGLLIDWDWAELKDRIRREFEG
jgi:hypothetical protein